MDDPPTMTPRPAFAGPALLPVHRASASAVSFRGARVPFRVPPPHARVRATVSVTGFEEGAPPADSSITSLTDVESIVELVKEFDVADLRVVDGDVAVEVSLPGGRGFKDGVLREPAAPVAPVAPPAFAPGYAPGVSPQLAAPGVEVEEEYEEEEEELEAPEVAEPDEDGIYKTDFVVTSNRVGFFFSGGKGKPPLANIDDHVAFNQPVCIIEQLGQQYVYLTEVSGTVVKIFAEDGDPIMYGSKIMVIRPD